jgi:hypothetical protein
MVYRRLHKKPTQQDNDVTAVSQALMCFSREELRELLEGRANNPVAMMRDTAMRHLKILDKIEKGLLND